MFFFPLEVPKIGFRREVSKQLSKREEYSLPLLRSARARLLQGGEQSRSVSHAGSSAGWCPGACGGAASCDSGLRGSPAFRPPNGGEFPPRACLSMLGGILSAEASCHSPCQPRARLPFSFTSICPAAPTAQDSEGTLCVRTCAVRAVRAAAHTLCRWRRRWLSPFPLLFCGADERLQIALRCVNLRCEIIDLERRLSRISGIDGFLSRLACDLER